MTELTQAAIYTTGGLDTIGAVLDSVGREIVSDDDGGEGRNFRVAPLLWPGEYFVRLAPWVSSSGRSEFGSYNLHAEGTPASIAQVPLDGSSKQGAIETGEGADYFSLEVTELTEAVIYTSGGLDTEGALLDSTGEPIASDDDSGLVGNFRVATLLWPGEYFVRVAPWVKFSGQFDSGGYSPHAEGRQASPVHLSLNGPPHSGMIESGDDEDYYRIAVTEPTAAVIYTGGSLDTAGVLLASNGEELAFNDDGGRSSSISESRRSCCARTSTSCEYSHPPGCRGATPCRSRRQQRAELTRAMGLAGTMPILTTVSHRKQIPAPTRTSIGRFRPNHRRSPHLLW